MTAYRARGFKDWGNVGELRSAIHALEALLEDGDSSIIAAMLMCRRHEKDYLLRGDLKYRDALLAQTAVLAEAAKAIPQSGELIACTETLSAGWSRRTTRSAEPPRPASGASCARRSTGWSR